MLSRLFSLSLTFVPSALTDHGQLSYSVSVDSRVSGCRVLRFRLFIRGKDSMRRSWVLVMASHQVALCQCVPALEMFLIS